MDVVAQFIGLQDVVARFIGLKEYFRVKLTWKDTEDIALELYEKYPDRDPLTIRFTDLHTLIISLPDFSDDPEKSNEGILEAIQMAWHEEYKTGSR
jgi:FeS assembly protein IscX